MKVFAVATIALILATAHGNAVSQGQAAKNIVNEIKEVDNALTNIQEVQAKAERSLGKHVPAKHSGQKNGHKAMCDNLKKAAKAHKAAAADYRAAAKLLNENGRGSVGKLFEETASKDEEAAAKLTEAAGSSPHANMNTEGDSAEAKNLRGLIVEQESKERELAEKSLDLATLQRASAAKTLADVKASI